MKISGRRSAGYTLSVVAAASIFLSHSKPIHSQQAAPNPSGRGTTAATEEGFPVNDAMVEQKCGSCHTKDAKGNMSRISYIRTTPEGWEEAIKRMIRLNGLQLSPDEARHILRYLSDSHGLAPQEAKKVEYFAERRIVDEDVPSPAVESACGSCHAVAKPLSWHRSAADWKYLKNMHIAFFPSADGSSFSGSNYRAGGQGGPPPAPRTGPDGKPIRAVDEALEWVVKSSPLHTADWSDWQAMMQAPKLDGTWLVSGREPGKGPFHGKMVVKPGAAPGDFITETTVKYLDGSSFTAKGASIMYTGYAWRGRAEAKSDGAGPGTPAKVREVMMLSADGSKLEGRWFWGVYQEFGMDVTLTRDTGAPALLGVSKSSLKSGTTGAKVTIFGENLPKDISAADVDLGAGVKVTSVESTPTSITVSADVASDARPGKRTISVKGTTLPAALAVYDHIDFLKVTPGTSLARLGSETHNKGFAQFEAEAFNFGPDGKAMTADDIPLGVVPATWKLEEFVASYGDDDVDFVGLLDSKTGLFTPASDGPNPKRRSMRNNYGDVWVVASYTPEGASKPVIGRSYLIVTVPQYLQYDQPEVAGR
jgi:quinohemoprotein amine dehydrogenase